VGILGGAVGRSDGRLATPRGVGDPEAAIYEFIEEIYGGLTVHSWMRIKELLDSP